MCRGLTMNFSTKTLSSPNDYFASDDCWRGESIFSVQKYYNRIEFQRENTSFYYDPDSAVAKAKDANLTPGALFSGAIRSRSADGTRYLIQADPLFFSQALTSAVSTISRDASVI